MSPVDIAIVVIILISTLIGVFRGFVRELLSLLAWVIALYLAWMFAPLGATYLEPYIPQPPLRVAGAFAGIFVVALIATSIIAWLFSRLLSFAGIKGVDRTLGLMFGVVRGVVVVAILILGAVFMDFASQPWWMTSKLVGFFTPVTDFLLSILGHFEPEAVEQFRPKVT